MKRLARPAKRARDCASLFDTKFAGRCGGACVVFYVVFMRGISHGHREQMF